MQLHIAANKTRPFKVGDTVQVFDSDPESRGWWKGEIVRFSDDNASVKVDFNLAKKWNSVSF